MIQKGKPAYVCGPLTELPPDVQAKAKLFYERIADVCHSALGVRAFVPHEHYDPIKHANFSPGEVYAAERRQIKENTGVLIVVASFGPSWGGGIEVDMADEAGIPEVILCQEGKNISRLLRGVPAVADIIYYKNECEALSILFNRLIMLLRQAKVA